MERWLTLLLQKKTLVFKKMAAYHVLVDWYHNIKKLQINSLIDNLHRCMMDRMGGG